jgi:hypothetical protein
MATSRVAGDKNIRLRIIGPCLVPAKRRHTNHRPVCSTLEYVETPVDPSKALEQCKCPSGHGVAWIGTSKIDFDEVVAASELGQRLCGAKSRISGASPYAPIRSDVSRERAGRIDH